MAACASLSPLGSDFDAFLFAPVCADRDDMPLSVLSALARLDLDAWEEASDLANLPGDAAAERLALRIAALPIGPAGRLDAGMIAARLIALLPRQFDPHRSSREAEGDPRRARLNGVIARCLIIMTVVFCVECLLATRQPSPDLAHGGQQPALNAIR